MSEMKTPPKLMTAEEYEIEKARALKEAEEVKSKKEAEEAKKKEEEDKYPGVGEIPEEELVKFWQCLLKKEPYTEDREIKGLKFTLSTRSGKQMQENSEFLDKVPSDRLASLSLFQMEVLLASSLLKLGEDELHNGTLEQRVEYIRELPAPLSRMLTNQMNNFDYKVFKMTDMIEAGDF